MLLLLQENHPNNLITLAAIAPIVIPPLVLKIGVARNVGGVCNPSGRGGKGDNMSKGTATEVEICGQTVHLGDHLKVKYTTGERMKGGTIEGMVTELWSPEFDNHHQGRLDHGWCFHNYDEIVLHIPAKGGKGD